MGADGTVLFVDDDESQRMLAKLVLGRVIGDRARLVIVGEARSARAALDDACRTNAHVLIISDQNMPGESGLELAVHAKRTYPGQVRFVLLADPAHLAHRSGGGVPADGAGPDLIVEKPLDLSAYRAMLERIVREWLESF